MRNLSCFSLYMLHIDKKLLSPLHDDWHVVYRWWCFPSQQINVEWRDITQSVSINYFRRKWIRILMHRL